MNPDEIVSGSRLVLLSLVTMIVNALVLLDYIYRRMSGYEAKKNWRLIMYVAIECIFLLQTGLTSTTIGSYSGRPVLWYAVFRDDQTFGATIAMLGKQKGLWILNALGMAMFICAYYILGRVDISVKYRRILRIVLSLVLVAVINSVIQWTLFSVEGYFHVVKWTNEFGPDISPEEDKALLEKRRQFHQLRTNVRARHNPFN